MQIKPFYIILIGIFVSNLIILISTVALGQTVSIDKTFTKCGTETSLLDSMNLSYDKACNEEYITIHNWQDIPILDQNTIIADMTSKGFNEIIVISNVTGGVSN